MRLSFSLVGKKSTPLSGDVKRIMFNWPIEHRSLNSSKGLSVSSDQFPQTEEGKRKDPTTALQLLLPLPWPTDDFWVSYISAIELIPGSRWSTDYQHAAPPALFSCLATPMQPPAKGNSMGIISNVVAIRHKGPHSTFIVAWLNLSDEFHFN